MGFGSDKFGASPFGRDDLEERLLWGSFPSGYRTVDKGEDDALQKYAKATGRSFSPFINKIGSLGDLMSPDTVPIHDSVVETELRAVHVPKGSVSQAGIDGTIDAYGQFSSPSARFTEDNVGDQIKIIGSTNPNNSFVTIISRVLDPFTIITTAFLQVDTAVAWEVRPVDDPTITYYWVEATGALDGVGEGWTLSDGLASFNILSRTAFDYNQEDRKRLTLADGTCTINSLGVITLDTALNQADVGKVISIVPDVSDEENRQKTEIRNIESNGTTLHTYLSGNFELPNGSILSVLPTKGHGDITITLQKNVDGGPFYIEVTSNTITVFLATDLVGRILTQASEVETALNSDRAARLVYATLVGDETAVEGTIRIVGKRLPSGTFAYSVLPFTLLKVEGKSLPLGVVEQQGNDLTVPSATKVHSTVATFRPSDIGKTITLRGSANAGDYKILSLDDSYTCVIDATLAVDTVTSLYWCIRSPTLEGLTVRLLSPSMAQVMASHYGISVSDYEAPKRQRALLRSISYWKNLKGSVDSYTSMGDVSGFNVSSKALYRVVTGYRNVLQSSGNLVIAPETDMSGMDGAILLEGPTPVFTCTRSIFKPRHVGQAIYVRSAGANFDAAYTVKSILTEKKVELEFSESPVAPDYGLGTISNPLLDWQMVRFYSKLPPYRPRFDEIRGDLLAEIVGPTHFAFDKFCWESDFVAYVTVDTLSVSPIVAQPYPILFEISCRGPAPHLNAPEVVLLTGQWKFRDTSGVDYFLETVPVLEGGVYKFKVMSATPPELTDPSPATLRYVCPEITGPEFSKSYRMLLTIEGDEVYGDGTSVDSIASVVEARVRRELKPAHADYIVRYQPSNRARLVFQATGQMDVTT